MKKKKLIYACEKCDKWLDIPNDFWDTINCPYCHAKIKRDNMEIVLRLNSPEEE